MKPHAIDAALGRTLPTLPADSPRGLGFPASVVDPVEERRNSSLQIGLWAFLGTVTMLFAGFSSAYLVRRSGSDWRAISLPPLLWLNTAVLALSSATLELARYHILRERLSSARFWFLVTTVLGIGFLAGQVEAWRVLAAQGVFLPTSPHSSFFFVLTTVHGAHLLGGIIALLILLARLWRPGRQEPMVAFRLCATYWHFVDGLWFYTFLLLIAF